MEYQIILTQNKELKKVLFKSKNKTNTFLKYRELSNESDNVIFEKKHVNNNGIIPVEYMLYVVKLPEEGETRRLVRDSMGKYSEEGLLFDQWTIMDSKPYRIEENLWIYGNDPRKDRKSVKDVVKVLIEGMGRERVTKEVIVCHNKLVIYNEEFFGMVICKCIKDAQRLHHLLYKTAIASKIKGLLFMGTANPVTISLLYEVIQEETEWPLTKIRRTTTRP